MLEKANRKNEEIIAKASFGLAPFDRAPFDQAQCLQQGLRQDRRNYGSTCLRVAGSANAGEKEEIFVFSW